MYHIYNFEGIRMLITRNSSNRAVIKKSLLGIILVTIAALSWSTAGLFTRVVTTDIPTTLFWRSLFGGISVLAFYIITQHPKKITDLYRVNRGEAVTILVASVATCCFIAAFFYTSIANVSFVYGLSALVTVMVAWPLLRKRPDRLTIIAAVIATLGALILVYGEQNFSDFVGLSLAGAMTLLMASLPVLTHRFPSSDGVKVAYMSAFLIAIFMAFLMSNFTLDSHNALWLFLYGIINVGLGFGVFLIGSRMVTPATAALIGLTEVPLAPIWAALLFAELLTPSVLIGGMIIFCAALLHVFASHFTNR